MNKLAGKKSASAARSSGMPWAVIGLLLGWVGGVIYEVVYGFAMYRMVVGGLIGLSTGTLVDWIRERHTCIYQNLIHEDGL
jgi:hypothetical protein